MTDSDKKEFEISIPGEWAIKKVFGPTLSVLGDDLKQLYAKGRDKLIAVATRKVENYDDGKNTESTCDSRCSVEWGLF